MSKKIIVLVVDDDRTLVDFLVHVLKKGGYNVVAALGGIQGLEKAEAIKPDLMVLGLWRWGKLHGPASFPHL